MGSTHERACRGVGPIPGRARACLPHPRNGRPRRHDAGPCFTARSGGARFLAQAQPHRARRSRGRRRLRPGRLERPATGRVRRAPFGMADPLGDPALATRCSRGCAHASLSCLRVLGVARSARTLRPRRRLFHRRATPCRPGGADHHERRGRRTGALARRRVRRAVGQSRGDLLRHVRAARDLRRCLSRKGVHGATGRAGCRLPYLHAGRGHARQAQEPDDDPGALGPLLALFLP